MKISDWDKLEDRGLVKIEAVPDNDADIDNVLGDAFNPEFFDDDVELAEKEKRIALENIERDGVWGVVGYFRLDDTFQWETGDSVWGFAGYKDVLNETENPYVTDIKMQTMQEYHKALTRVTGGKK